MLELNLTMKFHAVGQGCFYTSKIAGYKKKPFHFVYDCGSDTDEKILMNEISQFANEVNDLIDLVIVSHFDRDHINGISQLLRSVRGCRRLIIPYCDPIERLFLLATYSDADDFYYRLLQNPVEYFTGGDFNINEIIVVGTPDDEDDVKSSTTSLVNQVAADADTDRLGFTDHIDEEGSANFSASIEQGEKGSELQTKTTIKFYQIPFRFTIGDKDWEFVIYHKKGYRHNLIYRVTEEVKRIAGVKRSIYSLFDEEEIRKIKKLYFDMLKSNMNSTSLIVLHSKCQNKYNEDEYIIYYKDDLPVPRFGTMLTGDIDLDGPVKVRKLRDYFDRYFDDVKFFQIPHHGSKENWKVNNSSGYLYSFPFYVVNSGKKDSGNNKFDHPSEEVLADIIRNNQKAKIFLNNEEQEFCYPLAFAHESIAYTAYEGLILPPYEPMTFKRRDPKGPVGQ
ncbi:MAG: MBL fold metallo-hydrolase [Niastella sp.]|nr:MBL fold metallo-hydrolase [Niastella sp.]